MAASPVFDASANISSFKFVGTGLSIAGSQGPGASQTIWTAGENGGRIYAILARAVADQSINIAFSVTTNETNLGTNVTVLGVIEPSTIAVGVAGATEFTNVLDAAVIPGLPEVNGKTYLPVPAGAEVYAELVLPDPGDLTASEVVYLFVVGADY